MDDENLMCSLPNDLPEDKRPRYKCPRCLRPVTVCLCRFLPSHPLTVEKTNLIILQHPHEQKRVLHTVALLQLCMDKTNLQIYKGRRFSQNKIPELSTFSANKNTYVLYPSDDALPLEHIDRMALSSVNPCNIVILDGTWQQAKEMYKQNKFLHALNKIKIDVEATSEYVIRVQPNEKCLSTIECAAIALAHVEDKYSLYQALIEPLRALCQYQLDHGDQIHQCKR